MKQFVPLLALFLAAVPSAAQNASPALSLEQQMLLRCSAAFGIVANEQERGVTSTNTYPVLTVRGKEFAVRSGARLIDELHISREQYAALFKAEVERLQTGSMEADEPAAYVDSVMRPCLAFLDASGL
jgi:hypothetical protein